ncbi:MAG TPA: AI-2E family transporter [Taishania sp.]|nr:AI-2E family transporter [Taishania sp.]
MEKMSLPNIYKVSAAFFITGCILLVVYLASDVISPLILALLIAILLRPVVKFLHEKLRFPMIIAVTLTVVMAFLFLLSVVAFLGFQLTQFFDDLPLIKQNLTNHYHEIQQWIRSTLGVSYGTQQEYLEQSVTSGVLVNSSSISSITNVFMFAVLVPIYTFLILIYRTLLLNFIIKLVPDKHVLNIESILGNLKSVIRSYIIGLLIQVVCISLMTGLGYFFVGVKYYVFLGILTGLLNLIPYIGIIIAGLLSCLISMSASTDLSIVLWIILVNIIVQFIDNNMLVPKVVGSKVSINALASMIGVIIGGSLAGIAGMFLAIPVLAMLKVIFEATKGLEPFGYIIADEAPEAFNWTKIRLIYTKKMREEDEENERKRIELEQQLKEEQDTENDTLDN